MDDLLWRVPLAVGIQLQHFALRCEGVETVKPLPPEEAAKEADFDRLLTGTPEP